MKTKLLFINGHLNYGGVEKSLVDILSNINYNEYSVDLLLLEGRGDYSSFIPKEVNVILYDLHSTYGSMLSVMRQCLKKRDFFSIYIKIVFLLSNRFDMKIMCLLKPFILPDKYYDAVIGFRPGASTDFAAWLFKTKKRITWWHNGEIRLTPDQIMNYRSDCNEIDSVVVVSNGCRDMLVNELDIPKEKTKVIPNMIDSFKIINLSQEYIPNYLSDNKLNIISVGRLSKEKHFDDCIVSTKLLKENGIDFKWTIVGEGIERKKLEELINEYHLQDYVILLGKKNNPYPYMCYADIYVHSSYVESQCLTILESMALGIPCVVADSLGPREYCQNNINCIYVNHEKNALFEGIKQMLKLKNTKELEIMKINAKKTSLTFNVKEIMQLFYNLLNN